MAQFKKRKLSKKEEKAASKVGALGVSGRQPINQTRAEVTRTNVRKSIEVPEVISVKDFADRADLSVAEVISILIKNGVLATINQTIDFETASIIGDDLNLEIKPESVSKEKEVSSRVRSQISSAKLVSRPPVVTVMGHVDHGKTTLLDKIRETQVVKGESGGITQHISAYQVTLPQTKNKDLKGRTITFIDTPGHAAFSAMREHGASITDMVVLIVAADDGVMPQTKEVIEKTKEYNVPIIVAINKVDLPNADIMKVKQQLSDMELIPEEWGGQTVMVEISAKTGQNIDELLEMILLRADLMELKADPAAKAVGVVIESNLQKGTGSLAVVLIENGTIHRGEPVAIGSTYGRVRILEDFAGKRIDQAGPSSPVRVAGLKSLSTFGDRLVAFDNEKEAKEAALLSNRTAMTMHIASAQRIGSNLPSEPSTKIEFSLVLKSDVAGSAEAVKKLINEIKSEEIVIKVVSEGIGPISESDITLARATKSQVYGFRVPVLMAAQKIAENEKIIIKAFDVIYKLIDDIKSEASKLLPLEIIEEELGTLDVLEIFRDDKRAFVGGGKVLAGRLTVGDEIKVLQDGNDKYHDKVVSLRQGKNEVKECSAGIECGFSIASGAKVAVGDRVVAFRQTTKVRSLE